ncbi:MAG: hypothetical protein ACTSSH_02545 [Candidatus Heimdallarchaeota archaeon]
MAENFCPIVYCFNGYECFKCKKLTSIVVLLRVPSDLVDANFWDIVSNSEVFLQELTDKTIGQKISIFLPNFFFDYSFTADLNYFMNHCSHCKAKLGDHYIYHDWLLEHAYDEP